MSMRLSNKREQAFTLVELLVVIAIIAVLAAILFPVLVRATLRAKVSRVHSDLRQIAIAIEMYKDDYAGLPPVRSTCTGTAKWDYYDLPRELVNLRYLKISKMYDPFNRTLGDDDQLGRAYKYIAINWGYTGSNKGYFTMWIPRDYPTCNEDSLLYYIYDDKIYAFDNGKTYPKDPPIMWAVWSVGPTGDPGLQETGNRLLPVHKCQWYPMNENGIIARFSDGRKSP